MTLKTLGEMKHQGFFCQAGLPDEFSICTKGVSVEELRQSAIDDIKMTQEKLDHSIEYSEYDRKDLFAGQIAYIKQKFNISADDLK